MGSIHLRALITFLVGIVVGTPAVCGAAVTAEAVGESMNITMTEGDDAAVAASGGFIKINGLDPSTGPFAAATLRFLNGNILGNGSTYDLQGVTAAAFPMLSDSNTQVSGSNSTILGGDLPDTVSMNSGMNLTFHGGAGADTINFYAGTGLIDYDGGPDGDQFAFFDGVNGDDEITVVSVESGAAVLLINGVLQVTFANGEQLQFYPYGGNDSITVDSTGWAGPMNVYVNSGAGDDTTDLTSFHHFATTDVYPDSEGDDFLAHPETMLRIRHRLNTITDPLTMQLGRNGSMIESSITGGATGLLRFTHAAQYEVFGPAGALDFQSGDLEGAALSNVFVGAGPMEDQFQVRMSPTVSFGLLGGAEPNPNTLTVERNGFLAEDDGFANVTAPGAQTINYGNMQTVTIIGPIPTPTPVPSPSPSPSPTMSPSPTVTASPTVSPTPFPKGDVISVLLETSINAAGSDLTGDMVTDAGDVVFQENPPRRFQPGHPQ